MLEREKKKINVQKESKHMREREREREKKWGNFILYQYKKNMISFVWTQDTVLRTCWERWMIGVDGKKGSENSMMSADLMTYTEI